MKEETKKWIAQAERDFETAKYNLDGGKTEAGIFFLQQAAEKALKSLLIEKTGEFPKVHDLVRLGKLANMSSELLKDCEKLTLVYTETRYPDIPEEEYAKEEIAEYQKISEEIIKWTKKQLS